MKFKSLVITHVCVLWALSAHSQRWGMPNSPYFDDRIFHFGFVLAGNAMNFSVTPNPYYKDMDTLYGVAASAKPGFALGIINVLRLHEYLELRSTPMIAFGERNMIYSMSKDRVTFYEVHKKIETTSVDIPLELKWRSKRLHHWRVYVLGGVQYNLDIASMAKKQEAEDEEIIVKLRPHEFAFSAGFGFEFYLPHSNKIGIELRMIFGMNDVLRHEPNIFADRIESLKTKRLQIAITLE